MEISNEWKGWKEQINGIYKRKEGIERINEYMDGMNGVMNGKDGWIGE